MKQVRINVVDTEPMTRGDYNKMRGWQIPENENPADEGYVITYRKGQPNEYISWCPKKEADEVSISCENGLPFGVAIMECRYRGAKIQRTGWNGDGQYVVYQDCATFFPLTPEQRKEASPEPMLEATSACFVFHFVNRKTGETGIQVGWLASQADMAANDWVIVE